MSIETPTGSSHVGYQNLADAATRSASSAAADFPLDNAFDYRADDYWMPTAGGTQSITLDNGSAKAADYMGIAAHDLHVQGATVKVYGSPDNSTFTQLGSSAVPLSGAPFAILFAPASYRYYKVEFSGLAAAPRVGVLNLGARMQLQRGTWIGHAPAPYNRQVAYVASETEGGLPLPRSIQRVANQAEIALDRLTPTWVRASWVPFSLWCESRPFFFFWNVARFPSEVMFAMGTPSPPANSHQSFMRVNMPLRGLA